MKQLLILSLMVLGSFTTFAKDGSEGVGGGSDCERRIKDIGNDISSWISRNGHLSLKYHSPLSAEIYEAKMQEQIGRATVRCVSAGDEGFPVFVTDSQSGRNIAKECRFDLSLQESLITCDTQKFTSLSEAAQYQLIHHEYAGLAQIEKPDGVRSTYDFSNQITAFLENQIVKRLAVRKPQTRPPYRTTQDIEEISKTFLISTHSSRDLLTGIKNSAKQLVELFLEQNAEIARVSSIDQRELLQLVGNPKCKLLNLYRYSTRDYGHQDHNRFECVIPARSSVSQFEIKVLLTAADTEAGRKERALTGADIATEHEVQYSPDCDAYLSVRNVKNGMLLDGLKTQNCGGM